MKKSTLHGWLTIGTLLALLPGLFGLGLFDWDELNFAESTREMVASGNYLYNSMQFEPFWEKPPLFNWLQLPFVLAFGSADWVYRLPNILAAILAVNLSYHIGFTLGKRMLGSFWALSTLATFAPYFYWKSGLIDPWFNLLIVAALWKWFRMGQTQRAGERPHRDYALSGLFLGLAILTKGPVAGLLFGLSIGFVVLRNNRWNELFHPGIGLFLLSALLPVFAWLAPLYWNLGSDFLVHFFGYQLHLAAGQFEWHNQPWFYHALVLFFLCFPSSSLALPFLFNAKQDSRDFGLWFPYMRSLFWVVLILFSIVETKIIHYSSLCWWPLSFFGAYTVYQWHTNRRKINWMLYLLLAISGFLLAALIFLIPWLWGLKQIPTEWVLRLDLYTASIVKYSTYWHWSTLIPGLLMTLYLGIYLVRAVGKRAWHPAGLYALSLGTAVLVSALIVPAAEASLQSPLREELKALKNQNASVDLWGFKSYALPFWSEWTSKDCIDSTKWSHPHFLDQCREKAEAENTIQSTGFHLYPNRTARMTYFQDGPCLGDKQYVITRADFKPDWFFKQKFTAVKPLGGYWLWKRNCAQIE